MSHSHTAQRREDLRLITGRGRYTADVNLPGQLHAAFLRADRAHAQIVSIDTAPALAHPGVVAVLTGADALAAQYTQFPNLMAFTGRNGAQILKPERPVLATTAVRYVGENKLAKRQFGNFNRGIGAVTFPSWVTGRSNERNEYPV